MDTDRAKHPIGFGQPHADGEEHADAVGLVLGAGLGQRRTLPE